MNTHPIVRQIVGRCHVGDRFPDVLRHTISRLKNGKTAWAGFTRAQRRDLVRQVIAEHTANRSTYRHVMGGA